MDVYESRAFSSNMQQFSVVLRTNSQPILTVSQHCDLALWKKTRTSDFKNNRLIVTFFIHRHNHQEPAAYWSAPREHLTPIQQLIAYRGLSPQCLENAFAHENNGDSFNMLVELAVDMPYASASRSLANTRPSSTSQPASSFSIPSSSPLSSVSSVSPSLEES